MKRYALFIGVIIVVAGGAYMATSWSKNESGSLVPTATSSPTPNNQEKLLTLDEIVKHNNKEDCYLLIDGIVYDVTPYVKSGFHPGKEAILMGCGKDATELFNKRPGNGSAHSDKARTMLAKYEIGVLSE